MNVPGWINTKFAAGAEPDADGEGDGEDEPEPDVDGATKGFVQGYNAQIAVDAAGRS